jgi:hypothetical protein
MPAHTKFEGATVTVSLSFGGDLIERRLVPQADATRVAVLMLAAVEELPAGTCLKISAAPN